MWKKAIAASISSWKRQPLNCQRWSAGTCAPWFLSAHAAEEVGRLLLALGCLLSGGDAVERVAAGGAVAAIAVLRRSAACM